MQLKPVNFNFAGCDSQDGFLAHQFQEVCPYGVRGYKDEVDEDGKPVYQSMDSKVAIPILTKAIQELVKENKDLIVRLVILEKFISK
jgi:hypothetical protein